MNNAQNNGSGQSIGPVMWAAIIGTTCILLFLLQKILWLVVPFLLALVLYYLLMPLVQRLMFRGMSRPLAATLVTMLFLLCAILSVVLLLPLISANVIDWQNSLLRYLQGGMRLIEHTLHRLEDSSSLLARAQLAEKAGVALNDATGHAERYLEPVLLGIGAWAPALLLTPFLAYFFLRDGGRFQRMLGRAVPNAFFERTLYLLHEVDRTARAYFQGLIKLTVLDTVTLALGLWLIGIPGPLALGLICAVLAWVPFVGSIVGGFLVVLVAATDLPAAPNTAYWAVGLFLLVRLLDDFVYMPLTIGKSLDLHPLLSVLMIFIGGAIAGVPGLMLVLPLLGVVMVIGETAGRVFTDARLIARHRYALALRRQQASADLQL